MVWATLGELGWPYGPLGVPVMGQKTTKNGFLLQSWFVQTSKKKDGGLDDAMGFLAR